MTSKATSKEIALSPSAIDGTEIIRISKFINGEWENFKVNDQALANWILAQILLPPIATQIQSDWSATDPALVSFIKTKSVITNVASLQAAATAGTLNESMWYVLAVQSNFGVLRVRARDNFHLEQEGELLKDNKVYTVSYSLTDDFITRLKYDNLAIDLTDGDSNIRQANPFVSNLPLGNPNYSNIRSYASDLTIDDPDNNQVAQSTFMLSTVVMNHNGATSACSMTDVDARNSAITLNGINAGNPSFLSATEVWYSSLELNGSVLAQSYIDLEGGNVIFTNENYSNKRLIYTVFDSYSNFDKTRDITGGGAFSFNNAGYDESFVGVYNLTTSNPTESITSFTNNTLSYMTRTFYGQNGVDITLVHDGVNIFCDGGTNVVLHSANDFITFRFNINKAFQINSGIY